MDGEAALLASTAGRRTGPADMQVICGTLASFHLAPGELTCPNIWLDMRINSADPNGWARRNNYLMRFRMYFLFGTLLLLPLACAGDAAPPAHEPASQAAALNAESGAGPSPDFVELARYIEHAMEDWQVPGLAIAAVEGDSVVMAQGFGVRRLGQTERVDARTLFGIMSVTKPVTATALALLVDEGSLSWDDPVIQHLPGFRVLDPADTREIRVRDLLSHRTGYQEEPRLWRTPGMTREALHAHLADRPRQAPLRTRYLYSNQQYLVAGDLIEAVSGLAWDEFVEQRLFAPLGMTESTVTYRSVQGRSNLVSAHTRQRSGIRWTLQPIDRIDPDITAPAGGIFSNAEEMAAWLRLHANRGIVDGRRLVGAEPILEMQRLHISFPDERNPNDPENPFCRVVSCDAMGYGLGWVVMTYRGERAVVHSGGLDGQNAFVGLLPDRGIGVAVLVNRDETDIAPALVYRVFDLLLGAEPIDWSTELRRRLGS